MNPADLIRGSIKLLLDSASDTMAPLGLFQKVTLERIADLAEIYHLRRMHPISQLHDVVVLVPLSADTHPLATYDQTCKEWPTIKQADTMFVDCYSMHRDRRLEDLHLVSADDLWALLLGADSLIGKQDAEPTATVVAEQFLERDIQELEPTTHDDFRSIPRGNATRFLKEWAQEDGPETRNVLVVGERGVGKTWLLRAFTREQNKAHCDNRWITRPAFYVNLKDYAEFLFYRQGIEKSSSPFLILQVI